MIQQQVEVLKFEQVIISKIKAKAQKTSKLRDWLSLLKAYQQNDNFLEKDKAIRTMHSKFILNEEFWLFQIDRKRQLESLSEDDIDFVFLALEDGHKEKLPQIIYDILAKQLNKALQNIGNLRINYLIAKIEKLISMCRGPKSYYLVLKNYYKQTNNQKKTRETYFRQIRFGYDNHDVIYDEYQLWETNKTELQRSKAVYEQGKMNWQVWNEKGYDFQNQLNNIEQVCFDAFNYLQLVSELQSNIQKLFYLRIVCLKRHELYLEYFETLQQIYSQDEEYIIQNYQSLLDIIPQIETSYLQFLVRRINKHICCTQNKEYNDTWGQKVQFFRIEIEKLINKQRLTYRIRQSIQEKYYQFWVSVQTALIKDKDIICQLFEQLLHIKPTIDNYRRYNQSLVQLSCIGQAKNIVRRCRQLYKIDYEAHQLYMGFISIYGDLDDWINFRKMKNEFAHSKNKQQKLSIDQHVKIGSGAHQDELIQTSIEAQRRQTFEIPSKGENEKVMRNNDKQIERTESKISKKEKEGKNNERKDENKQNDEVSQKINNEQEQARKKMFTDAGNTIFVKGFPVEWREQEIREIIKNKDFIQQIRLIQKGGHPQNYCYIQMSSAQNAQKQINDNQYKSKYVIAISKPPEANKEQKTLFLAGLPQSVTEQKIKQLFEEFGEDILSIRLRVNENKNIGYVDFSCEQKKNLALLKFQHRNIFMDEKRIIIKESNSKPTTAKKQLKVIILKQLAYKAKEKDIVEFFKDFNIEDVFIPEGENGKSKGFAFVKFKTMNDYTQVLKMTSGVIKGRTFDIRKSERDIQRPKVEKKEQVSNSYFSNLFK